MDQYGKIVGDVCRSNKVPIAGVAQQGCLLSPWSLCAALECAMRKWRRVNGQDGIDLIHEGRNFLDFRFGDDILIFARSRPEFNCSLHW